MTTSRRYATALSAAAALAATGAAAAQTPAGGNAPPASAKDAAAAAAARAGRDGIASPPPVISTAQIDRYDALKQLDAAVKNDPKSVADWVMLGEIAHEVAMDAPADEAGPYFRRSREAFEKAAELAPDNRGIQAAVEFAREEMKNVDAFEKSRDLATTTYLAARRRDLAATGMTPHVRVLGSPEPAPAVRSRPGAAGAPRTAKAGGGTPVAVAPPAAGTGPGTPVAAGAGSPADRPVSGTTPPRTTAPTLDPVTVSGELTNTNPGIAGGVNAGKAPTTRAVAVTPATEAVTPPRRNDPSADTANYGVQLDYTGATVPGTTYRGYPVYYRSFAGAQGDPYTYREYNAAYFPSSLIDGSETGNLPVTLQRATSGNGPAVVPNAYEREILNRAAAKSATGTAGAPVVPPVPGPSPDGTPRR